MMQASKWIRFQMLISSEELKELFNRLNPFTLYDVSHVHKQSDGLLCVERFLAEYTQYIKELLKGDCLKTFSAPALTRDPDAVEKVQLSDGRFMWRAKKPLIQVRPHHFTYSALDHTFHPGIRGKESISWGIEFSIPQLFRDVEKKEERTLVEVPNFALLKELRAFVRSATLPAQFAVNGCEVVTTMRIGKEVLAWDIHLLQLKARGIKLCALN